MKKALESLQLVGPPQSLLFSARLKNRSPMRPYPRTERSEFQFPTETPNSPTDPIFLCSRFVSNSRNASRALAPHPPLPAAHGRPPAHPLQPPTAAAADDEGGEDERGCAVRGADGAGVRRGGPAGRGRAGVAVPVRGGAPAARLDLLLPPPLQRPLPIPPRTVRKIGALPFPSLSLLLLWCW